jgi:TPR repeat protein
MRAGACLRTNAEAARGCRLAAEQGDADGQNLLGAVYANGKGVPQDYVQSHMWLNLSAAQGLETARNERDIIAERMTPAQIAEAQRLAREWTEKHEK